MPVSPSISRCATGTLMYCELAAVAARDVDRPVSYAGEIAGALVKAVPNDPNPYWDNASRTLIRGLVLYVMGLEERNLGALRRLLAVAEAYPALKASENFLQLQRDLVAVEEQLQYARRFYNGAVRDYNDGTQRFPVALVARGFGFGGMEFFQAGEDEREPVRVELAK